MTAYLALSDVLVVRALERACIRGIDGSSRSALARRNIPRHRAYEEIQIPTSRHARALEDAFAITHELTATWDMPVAASEWSAALDAYCRQLLTTQRPRSLVDLQAALGLVGTATSGR